MNRKKFLKLGVLAAILAPITKAFSNPMSAPEPDNDIEVCICINGKAVRARFNVIAVDEHGKLVGRVCCYPKAANGLLNSPHLGEDLIYSRDFLHS
jgi:hypothetical protein